MGRKFGSVSLHNTIRRVVRYNKKTGEHVEMLCLQRKVASCPRVISSIFSYCLLKISVKLQIIFSQ